MNSRDTTLERVMPHSEQLEQVVLGSILAGHKKSQDVLDSLETGDFFDGRHRVIFARMLEMRQAEGITLGQDEASSLIYGMPKAAFERGAVSKQYSLANMADAMLDHA